MAERYITGYCKMGSHENCDGALRYATGWNWYCVCVCHPEPAVTKDNAEAVEFMRKRRPAPVVALSGEGE